MRQPKNAYRVFCAEGSGPDPYGNLVDYTYDASVEDNPFRFSTKCWDAETGLYYYGYRYYSPGLGRWLSRDPIGEWGGQNLHLFVRNSPVTLHDWLGMFALDDNINGVPDCGVALYLTHTYNVGTLDVSGAKGCRRAGITSCYSARTIPGIDDQSNLIDIPLSDGTVGISDTADNGGYGSGMAGFIAYMKAVMLAAKGAAEGLCPPDHFLDDDEDNKKCKHDEPDCKCRTCDIYRANASDSYPEGHWLHYDSDTSECCHCRKITFKFMVPNSSDNQTYMNIVNQSSGQWAQTIGIGNHGTRTYDCKTKTWAGGGGSGGLF